MKTFREHTPKCSYMSHPWSKKCSNMFCNVKDIQGSSSNTFWEHTPTFSYMSHPWSRKCRNIKTEECPWISSKKTPTLQNKSSWVALGWITFQQSQPINSLIGVPPLWFFFPGFVLFHHIAFSYNTFSLLFSQHFTFLTWHFAFL